GGVQLDMAGGRPHYPQQLALGPHLPADDAGALGHTADLGPLVFPRCICHVLTPNLMPNPPVSARRPPPPPVARGPPPARPRHPPRWGVPRRSASRSAWRPTARSAPLCRSPAKAAAQAR